MNLFGWTNGELSIWMDNERGHGLAPIAEKVERDLGTKVKIETPERITDSFPIAAQAGEGPDMVIWAQDKLGEWADAGLIAPVEVPQELVNKFLPKAWEAVAHRGLLWGYPIALETVSLIYNKALLDGPPPADVLDQKFWLLQRGKMPAFGHSSPSLNVEDAFHPRAWRHRQFVREQRHSQLRHHSARKPRTRFSAWNPLQAAVCGEAR